MSGRHPPRPALLAALLLLAVHCLLPALHRCAHSAAAARIAASVCGDCGRCEIGPAGGSARRTPPANLHDHTRAGDCALCDLMLLGRDLLPAGAGAAVPRPAVSPLPARPLAAALAGDDGALRPPVRGPPAA